MLVKSVDVELSNFNNMNHISYESEDELLSKDPVESPFCDEGNTVSGTVLKKGPWTSAEDALLVDYVRKYGEGNWNAVQKHSGLSRCGKSCRLRWANHLRPNLKKGAFTVEEEQLIIELHAKMGNKWARMAANLPGRTDNEIKNYWNTRIKRRQRAGLPLYPPEICLQAFQSSHVQSTVGVKRRNTGHTETNIYGIVDDAVGSLQATQALPVYVPGLSDIIASSIAMNGSGSSRYPNFLTMQCPKRLRQSMISFFGYSGSTGNDFPAFKPITCDTKTGSSMGLSFTCDPDPPDNPPFGAIQDTDSYITGNFSASKPAHEAVKLELPSLQYPDTDFISSWGVSSLTPPFESVDAFIPSPTNGTVRSEGSSPKNSGLLDALLHESKILGCPKNHSPDKRSNSSIVTPTELADSAAQNFCEPERISPYGSSISVLCGHIPKSRMMDVQTSAEISSGCNIKTEPVDHDKMLEAEQELSTRLDLPVPDTWLESAGVLNDKAEMNDAIAALLSDDLVSDFKHMTSAASSQGWGCGSCPWNNMPMVCQMSELP